MNLNENEKDNKFNQLKQSETKFNQSILNFPKSKSPIPTSNIIKNNAIDIKQIEIKSSNALNTITQQSDNKSSLIQTLNNFNKSDNKSKNAPNTQLVSNENNTKSNNFYILNRNLNKKLPDKEEHDKLGYLEDNKNLYNYSTKSNNYLNTDIDIARNAALKNNVNNYKYDIMSGSGKVSNKIEIKQNNNILMNSSSTSKMFPNINKSLSPKQIQYTSNNNFSNSLMKSQSPINRIDTNNIRKENKINSNDLKQETNKFSGQNSNIIKQNKIEEKSNNIKLINGLSPLGINSNNLNSKLNEGKIKTIKMENFVIKDKSPVSIVSPKNFTKNQSTTTNKFANFKSLSPVNKNLEYSNNLSKLIVI